MNTETKLGKIKNIDIKSSDGQFGLYIEFSLDGGSYGVTDPTQWVWDPATIEVCERTEWTEEDRSKKLVDIMHLISKLLNETKNSSLSSLVGTPVEVTIEKRNFKSFRVLTEVL